MWKATYQERLADWVNLRANAALLEKPDQLILINDWWFRAPIVNHLIHWENALSWPTPWYLLNNNGYCELARALGIVYTLMLLDKLQYTNLEIISTGQDNLVRVDSGKYILNWAPGEVLNINSTPLTVLQRINSKDLASFLQ